jgi:hypothetical protein
VDPIVLKPGGGEAINVAGNDEYFKELSKALAQESFSPDLVARLSAKYDIEFP